MTSRDFGQFSDASTVVMPFITKALVLSSHNPWLPLPLRPWRHLWMIPYPIRPHTYRPYSIRSSSFRHYPIWSVPAYSIQPYIFNWTLFPYNLFPFNLTPFDRTLFELKPHSMYIAVVFKLSNKNTNSFKQMWSKNKNQLIWIQIAIFYHSVRNCCLRLLLIVFSNWIPFRELLLIQTFAAWNKGFNPDPIKRV